MAVTGLSRRVAGLGLIETEWMIPLSLPASMQGKHTHFNKRHKNTVMKTSGGLHHCHTESQLLSPAS